MSLLRLIISQRIFYFLNYFVENWYNYVELGLIIILASIVWTNALKCKLLFDKILYESLFCCYLILLGIFFYYKINNLVLIKLNFEQFKQVQWNGNLAVDLLESNFDPMEVCYNFILNERNYSFLPITLSPLLILFSLFFNNLEVIKNFSIKNFILSENIFFTIGLFFIILFIFTILTCFTEIIIFLLRREISYRLSIRR